MRSWWIGLVLVLSLGTAFADTGGSMGGGDWGGGGGGGSYSGGGGGGYSGGNSYSYSSGGGSGSSGPMTGGELVLILLFVIGYLVITAISQDRERSQNLSLGLGSDTPSYDAVDVSVLRLALDGRARKFVQTELARIAKIADTRTADGRLTMLREVDLLLRRSRDAWVYGGAINEPMRSLQAAKGVFDGHVTDARARFRDEVIRNEQGTITTSQASETIPRSEEGAGLILVSIIVAARGELFTVAHIADGEDLRKALEAASHRPAADLVAIEIVWQPSEDTDRLSSMELEAKYPHPELIPIRGALVGKAFCSYCGGPFPAELVSCPHCGAPAPGLDSTVPRAA